MPPASQTAAAPVRATLDRYCVSCHNDRLRTGGLTLASLDPVREGGHADVWERVVRKLRTREMPPAGTPRPDEAAYVSAVGALEAVLDADAAARPQPGRVAVHRLSRTEYANAVRDLLAVDLPAQGLLPADEPDQQTFDNVASVLSVSPALIENYLSAVYRVSRLAVADPSAPPAVETYTVPLALTQDERVSDDLPFGSQGGIAVRHQFPGRRRVHDQGSRCAGSCTTTSSAWASRTRIDVRLDGEASEAVHDRRRSARADRAGDLRRQHAGCPGVGGLYAHRRRRPARPRVPVTAGEHDVGVSFVADSGSPRAFCSRRRPVSRGRRTSMYHGNPAVDSVAIAGSCGAARGRSPSQPPALFVCAAGRSGREEDAVRQADSVDAARRAYRRPVNEEDFRTLLRVLQPAAQGATSTRHSAGNGAAACGPEFPVPNRTRPSGRASRDPRTDWRDVELASRLSFFLWSSIPDDELLDAATKGQLSNRA